MINWMYDFFNSKRAKEYAIKIFKAIEFRYGYDFNDAFKYFSSLSYSAAQIKNKNVYNLYVYIVNNIVMYKKGSLYYFRHKDRKNQKEDVANIRKYLGMQSQKIKSLIEH